VNDPQTTSRREMEGKEEGRKERDLTLDGSLSVEIRGRREPGA